MMTIVAIRPTLLRALWLVGGASLCLAQTRQDGAVPTGQDALAAFKAAGKHAALTVLPANLAGRPSKQVGEVVGMMLERAGMQNLELSAAEFKVPDKADLAQTAAALTEFVRVNSPATDYVLFADFLGTPAGGVTEVRAIVVGKSGGIVWQDRQTPDDADFKRIRPREPMQCCLLVAERLRSVLSLDDPTRADAPSGKLAERWRQRTGLPDDAEQAAMKERLASFKKAAPTATVLIYPVQAGEEWSSDSAVRLADLINGAKLTSAKSADAGPRLDIAGDMNQQKVLWTMARGVAEHVRKSPADCDYVLYAHYLMGGNRVGGVHFAICDRAGQLVVVDFQNEHWDDFKAVNPQSREDCDRLVLKRLESYLR